MTEPTVLPRRLLRQRVSHQHQDHGQQGGAEMAPTPPLACASFLSRFGAHSAAIAPTSETAAGADAALFSASPKLPLSFVCDLARGPPYYRSPSRSRHDLRGVTW